MDIPVLWDIVSEQSRRFGGVCCRSLIPQDWNFHLTAL
jgi:hypothetical protein